MRILFMGTPDIAAECLKALYAAGHEICGVYTRRDKPVGRKQVLTAPPVKEVALEHGTPGWKCRRVTTGICVRFIPKSATISSPGSIASA